MSDDRALSAVELSSDQFAEWDEFVNRSSSGSVYSLSSYLDTLCSCAGGTFSIIAVRKGGVIASGAALYQRQSRAGAVVTNRLLLYYNGIVLADCPSKYPSEQASHQIALIDPLVTYLSRAKFAQVTLHHRSPLRDMRVFQRAHWSVAPAYSYVAALTDLPALEAKIDKNFRRLVRRAEESGLKFSDDDDFDSFFSLHNQVHERKEAPLYLPANAFRRFWHSLYRLGLARLMHARTSSGTALASQLVLMSKHPVTHTVCAGSSKDGLSLGSTPFLRISAFRHLAALGYCANDLTDATLNPVTRFKSQLGAELETSFVTTSNPNIAFTCMRLATSLIHRLRGRA